MALIDETRMDRTVLESVTGASAPSDREYWRGKSMEERLAALELTRQILNGYDPDSTRLQRILEVARHP